MLTLDNFEQKIDPEIIQRGRQYYKSGHVHDLEADDRVWRAFVAGTDDYEVEIEKEADGSLTTYCDCPYEYGLYCKHVVAVLYAIRAEHSGLKVEAETRQEHRQSVRTIIEGLTREQLLEIVLEQVRKDRTLGNEILLRYSQEIPSKATYSQMIQAAVRAERERDSYLDYTGAIRAARRIHPILDQAEQLIADNQAVKALPILQAVVETMPSAMEAADDSNGELMGCMDRALNLLEDAASTLGDSDRKMLLQYCLEHLPTWQHQGFDYEYTLLSLAGDLVRTPQERETLFAVLDDNLSNQRSYHFSDYWQEAIVETKEDVMTRLGEPPEKIREFLLKYAHLDRIRQRLIQMYIAQGQFSVAADMCMQAIAEYERDKPGLVIQYRNLLIEIVRKEGKPDAVAGLAKKQFLESRDFQYYDLLKRHVPESAWPKTVQELIQAIKNEHMSRWLAPHVLPEIYVREGMWPQLLEIARQYGVEIVNRYQMVLHDRYPDEVCQIYERKVFDMLRPVSGRDTYQSAANYLRRMIDLGQPDRVGEIVELLKAEYPRRKAMIEELDRL